MLKEELESRILSHSEEHNVHHDEQTELEEKLYLLSKIIAAEKEALLKIWDSGKINLKNGMCFTKKLILFTFFAAEIIAL